MTLTKNDLKELDIRLGNLKGVIVGNLKGVISEELDNQEDKFENKLTEFKSEFFEKIDPILKEVTTAREERPLIENRLEALEEIHPKGKHVITS